MGVERGGDVNIRWDVNIMWEVGGWECGVRVEAVMAGKGYITEVTARWRKERDC